MRNLSPRLNGRCLSLPITEQQLRHPLQGHVLPWIPLPPLSGPCSRSAWQGSVGPRLNAAPPPCPATLTLAWFGLAWLGLAILGLPQFAVAMALSLEGACTSQYCGLVWVRPCLVSPWTERSLIATFLSHDPRENPAVLTLGAGGTGASLSHGDLVGIAWKSFCPAGGYSAARALRDGGSPTPGLGIFNLPAHFFGASKVQGVLAQSALWDLLAYSLSLLATPEIGQ